MPSQQTSQRRKNNRLQIDKLTEVSRQVVDTIDRTLRERKHFDKAVRAVRRHEKIIRALPARHPTTPQLLGRLARWLSIDAGQPTLGDQFSFSGFVKDRLSACENLAWEREDWPHLYLAAGIMAVHDRELEEAIEHLQCSISTTARLHSSETLATIPPFAHYYKATAHNRRYEYEAGLKHIRIGMEMAESEAQKLAMKPIELWAELQLNRKKAREILIETEPLLKSFTEEHTLAWLYRMRTRIKERLGDCSGALRENDLTLGLFDRKDQKRAQHLVDRASILNLCATRENDSERKENLRSNALACLIDAEALCGGNDWHFRVIGMINIVRGRVALNQSKGDYAVALGCAKNVLDITKAHPDAVLEIRAEILNTRALLTQFDQGTHNRALLEEAERCMQDAKNRVQPIDHARLKARVSIWASRVALKLGRIEESVREHAIVMIAEEDQDDLRDDLQELEKLIGDAFRTFMKLPDGQLIVWDSVISSMKKYPVKAILEQVKQSVVRALWFSRRRLGCDSIRAFAKEIGVSRPNVKRYLGEQYVPNRVAAVKRRSATSAP